MPDTFRDALRSLRRASGFALLVTGILAVGVGLNAAIFTVVDCVLLRPLGYRDADRIVSLQTRYLPQNRVNTRLGGADYVDLAQQVHGIETAAYYQNWDGGVQVRGASSIVPLAHVSPRFGEVMGVQPVAGRLFRNDDAQGTDALVSARFARDHFASEQAALGQGMRSEDGLYTIVGVLPDGFAFPDGTSVWLEADAKPQVMNRTSYNQRAVAKRRAGTSPLQLDGELATFSKHLQQSYIEDRTKALEAVSLQQRVVGNVAPTLHLLMASVAVVLLIVCANITHLQLVRATRQVREVAVRSALGASRKRLAMGALVEAALLSLLGGFGALLLALPALKLLVRFAPAGLPRIAEVKLNGHVLLYSLLVSFVMMAATSLLPVWRAWHVDQSMVLRQDSARGLEGRSTVRLRGAFLVVQVAFTLVLAATAVLLARQLVSQSREDLGFDMAHLYTLDSSVIETAPAQTRTEPATAAGRLEQEAQEQSAGLARLARLNGALETLRSTPGVTDAEAINGAPLGFGGSNVGYAIHGKTQFVAGAVLPNAEMKPITPGALHTLHVPLLRGRLFTPADRTGSLPVLLVSKQLADTVFRGEDPIGKQIMCGYDRLGGWWTIVGVTGNVKDKPGTEPEQTMYVPIAQHPGRAASMQLLVRTAPGAQLSEEVLRKRLMQANPDVAATAATMAQNFTAVERDLRFRTILFESFAGVSVLLAMLGMYGATAYSVTQRTFEFGVRMALGATRKQVMTGVLRGSLWIALMGAVTGSILYMLLLRVVSGFVDALPADPAAFAMAAAGVIALAIVAAAFPARRASTIDPMRALRMD